MQNKGGWINSEMVSFQEKKSMCKSSGTLLPFVSLLNRCACTLHCSDNLNEELHVFWNLWGPTTTMSMLGCHFSLDPAGFSLCSSLSHNGLMRQQAAGLYKASHTLVQHSCGKANSSSWKHKQQWNGKKEFNRSGVFSCTCFNNPNCLSKRTKTISHK